MRSHMILNSSETDENLRMRRASTNKKKSSCNNLEADFHVGYELRENPKKTWRISGSANGITRKREVCKECGKEFQSQKALFGHMKCHTDRYSHGLVEENSSSVGDGAQKLVDNLSKNEGDDARTRRRRSRRTRYGSSPSFSATHAAASVSEIEQEEEDVAMCLMLLSRDVGSWGGIIPVVTESSGNDAIVFEIRSSFIEKKTAGKDGDLVCKMKKPIEEKEEFDDSDTESGYYNRSWSDCGLLMNGTKKTVLDALDDGFIRYDEFKKPKIGRSSTESAGGETCYEVSDVKLGKDSRMKEEHGCSSIEFSKTPTRRVVAELGMDSSEECTINQVDSKFGRYISNKRTRYIACDAEIGSESHNKMSYDASDNELGKDHYKKSRFQCTACNKSFQSYQALGGHRASHKKVKGCFASRIESGDNSVETDSSPDPATDDKLKPFRIENLTGRGTGELRHGLKRKKAYECPICLKVFASGQALGGHKRSHLVGNSESRANACQTVIIQQQVPEIPDLLDLNLPAPIDEQTYSHVDFNPWLAGSDHKYKPLMGLISS